MLLRILYKNSNGICTVGRATDLTHVVDASRPGSLHLQRHGRVACPEGAAHEWQTAVAEGCTEL